MNPPIEQNNNEDLNLMQRQEGNESLKSLENTSEMALMQREEANTKLDDISRTLDMQLEQNASRPEIQKVELIQPEIEDDQDKLANTFYKMLRGKKGEKGEKGEKGDQGIQGEKGETGEDGYSPIKGRDYFDGEKGEKGDTGPQGIQGLTGPQGEKGADGKDGQNANIEQIKKLIPKPETTETLVSKLKDKLSFSDLKDIPMYLRKVASKTMSLFELDDTSISNPTNDQVLKYNSTTGKWENAAASGGGTPGGSTTQLQYNNAGSFGGISGATTNGTATTFTTGNLVAADVKASGSGGLSLLSNAGTQTALIGAGGGANNTFYGGIKGDYLTASEMVITDASKNIVSASVATYPSLTELSYVKGVTSAIQTQLDAKGVGSVTSVSFTGGLISVATATSTPALTVAGTSGGIPYFSSASTWATSGALAANALVIGGGAGAAPATTTTGTGVLTALGINVGSAGAFVTFNGALGTPSSGTVTNLTGTASININGTVGATTPTTGAFTTASTSSTLTASTTIELGHASDTTISRVSAGVIAVEGVTIPSISSTNTLTNKAITKRVVTTTDDATAVIDVAVTDVYELTAMANATAFSFTGTPTDGQTFVIRYKDNGTSRALTWTGITAIGVTLPTASTISKWGYVGIMYNAAASAYHATAVATEA